MGIKGGSALGKLERLAWENAVFQLKLKRWGRAGWKVRMEGIFQGLRTYVQIIGWKFGIHRCVTYIIQKSSVLSVMIHCHFTILNSFYMRNLTFSFSTGLCNLCNRSWVLPMLKKLKGEWWLKIMGPQIKWERKEASQALIWKPHIWISFYM